jgi:hypothetical protein
MKFSRTIILSFMLLVPQTVSAQTNAAAEQAWKPFIAAFRIAVKKRDRAALKKMMADDFFTSGGIGDDNQDGDSRNETFKFWDESYVRGWEAFDKVLAQGAAPMAAWWDPGENRRHVSRVAPPSANVRRNIKRALIDWYAIFEFRDGRWICTVFAQCCD